MRKAGLASVARRMHVHACHRRIVHRNLSPEMCAARTPGSPPRNTICGQRRALPTPAMHQSIL